MADRFKRIYKQGAVSIMEVWVDTETGVNYLYREDGYSGGLTPLLDRDGKPVIADSQGVGFKIGE
ncbi:MAG: xylan 1,4-beta-xylosidase [Oscillospiraceae bacterium]|nr:xylan 1,4-beta-xylosidase [Oscillospiraceae bacterium]